MEIIVGKTAGFCFGVANAVNKTRKILDEKNNVYCLGELVHNKEVNNSLQEKGLIIIDDINKAKENVIIRSHGAESKIYDEAKRMKLNTIDLTCPKVLRIHDIASRYSKEGYYIFLIGNKTHPETIGTISYCGINSCVIESKDQIDQSISSFKKSNLKKLLIIVQTTFSVEKFNNIVSIIEKELNDNNKNFSIEVINTICDATKKRQIETEELSSNVDMMIIIGGKNSSNTNKLYEISKENCKNSILIETYKELNIDEIKKYNRIGIMAGASTPQKSIEAVVEKLMET